MNELSAYVHVPYCKSKCAYCDFASWSNRDETRQAYFSAVNREILTRPADRRSLSSVYFGGGTPSYVQSEYIIRTLDTLNRRYAVDGDAEITIEANPATFDAQKMKAYAKAGVNRVSIGMQASQPELLKTLNRIHTPEDTLRAVENVRSAGIDNISIDIMFSLPGQTVDDLLAAIEFALLSGVCHMSVYGLSLQEDTPLAAAGYEPDEDLDRAMYHAAVEHLDKAGLFRYEISNFAVHGRECRHNLLLWQGEEYIGFGAAAHSFYGQHRQSNPHTIDEYLTGFPDSFRLSRQDRRIDDIEYRQDFIMLGLRLVRGVDESEFVRRFHVNLNDCFADIIHKNKQENLLVHKDGFLSLTEKGFDFANRVMGDFLS